MLATAAFMLFGILAVRVSQESARVTLQERLLTLTEAIATAADGWLRHEIAEFQAVSSAASLTDSGLSAGARQAALQDLLLALRSYSSLQLYDRDGSLLARAPSDSEASLSAGEVGSLLRRAVELNSPAAGAFRIATPEETGEARLVAAVSRPEGEPLALVGTLRLFDKTERLLPTVQEGFPIAIALIDQSGERLAGEADPDLLPRLLAPLASSKTGRQVDIRAGVPAASGREPRLRHVSFAPLRSLPAGILLEYPEKNIPPAASGLTKSLLIFGSVALALVSASAWIHARWVIRPVRRLEEATRRLAAGSLDQPLVSDRGDEIGSLTASFEEMRKQLKTADEERRRWQAQLEKRVAERTRQVRRLLGSVIAAQEEERGRLARELHDETAQAIATAQMAVEAIRGSLDPNRHEQRELMDSVLAQCKTALVDVRRMVMDLRPSVLENMRFAEALPSWAEQRLAVAGTKLKVRVNGKPMPLGRAAEIALFRIFQEAVNNVVRHAQATQAQLRLTYKPDLFVGELSDDGKGFDTTAEHVGPGPLGVGLQSMRERAELLGARLEVKSKPGAGATVRLEYQPIPGSEQPEAGGRDSAVAV